MHHDDLEHLLGPKKVSPNTDHQQLLARTERRLHRNRRHRQAKQVLTLAASFGLGMLSLWLLRPDPLAIQTETIRYVRVEPEPPPEPRPDLSGYELELLAEQTDGPEGPRLFRAAGDEYYADRDYLAAERCYALYLDLAPRSEWDDPDRSDTMLLVALKNQRRTEISYANPNG